MPLRIRRKAAGGGFFAERFARPDPEELPTGVQNAQRGKCQGDDDRIVAKRGCGDPGSEEAPLRLRT